MNDLDEIQPNELQGLLRKDPVDPYPLLPLVDPRELRDGDVLMMLGMGNYRGIPISWLIRYLDGGAYSHSAMVTLEDGAPMVWDHSKDWQLAPVSFEQGVSDHWWAHLYRLRKEGQDVGSDRFPPQPLVDVLQRHRGDPYEMNYLLLAGVIGVLSRRPKDARVRKVCRWAMTKLAIVLSRLIDREDIKKDMLICTSVTGLSFWEALNETPNDYALRVDLDRRREDRDSMPEPVDEEWDAAVAGLMAQLQRVFSDLDAQLVAYDAVLNGSNTRWVDVGGPQLPANLVSPADLEFSNVLERIGKLAIPMLSR